MTEKEEGGGSIPNEHTSGRNAASVICLKVRKGRPTKVEDLVPVEEPIAVLLNGKHAIDVTMSPEDAEDFVIGHLICEGIIERPEDIRNLSQGEGWVEALYEGNEGRPLIRETILSACFGQDMHQGTRISRLEADLELSQDQIRLAVERVRKSETHRLTGGVHTCGLFRTTGPGANGEPYPVSLCDDVGRHTALDKAVGKAARMDTPFENCFAVTTGRASSEMVAKCYQAGIPILASLGATTTLAIEISRLAGITLVGFARTDRMNIYANEWRIPT